MRILITGERGVGKTTLADRVFEKLIAKPVGFRTIPLYENYRKVGYFLQDLQTGEKRLFAHRDFTDAERFAEFGLHKRVFEEFGISILTNASLKSGWILLDEIGVMEMGCAPFVEALGNLWRLPRNQFWVVQKRSPFLETLAKMGLPYMRFEVTVFNRVELAHEILKEIRNSEGSADSYDWSLS